MCFQFSLSTCLPIELGSKVKNIFRRKGRKTGSQYLSGGRRTKNTTARLFVWRTHNLILNTETDLKASQYNNDNAYLLIYIELIQRHDLLPKLIFFSVAKLGGFYIPGYFNPAFIYILRFSTLLTS